MKHGRAAMVLEHRPRQWRLERIGTAELVYRGKPFKVCVPAFVGGGFEKLVRGDGVGRSERVVTACEFGVA